MARIRSVLHPRSFSRKGKLRSTDSDSREVHAGWIDLCSLSYAPRKIWTEIVLIWNNEGTKGMNDYYKTVATQNDSMMLLRTFGSYPFLLPFSRRSFPFEENSDRTRFSVVVLIVEQEHRYADRLLPSREHPRRTRRRHSPHRHQSRPDIPTIFLLLRIRSKTRTPPRRTLPEFIRGA